MELSKTDKMRMIAEGTWYVTKHFLAPITFILFCGFVIVRGVVALDTQSKAQQGLFNQQEAEKQACLQACEPYRLHETLHDSHACVCSAPDGGLDLRTLPIKK